MGGHCWSGGHYCGGGHGWDGALLEYGGARVGITTRVGSHCWGRGSLLGWGCWSLEGGHCGMKGECWSKGNLWGALLAH